MNHYDAIQAISHLTVASDYYFQISLDKAGKVITSNSGIGPTHGFFGNNEKTVCFADCFEASDWGDFESRRTNAEKNAQNSFTVDLRKINYPQGDFVDTKWEFFFITEDFGTCWGIGHSPAQATGYNLGLGDFFDSTNEDGREIIDSILEDKLLGFWEFDLAKKSDKISQGLGQMLGYTQDELAENTPISWRKHIHPEDFQILLRDLATHLKTSGNVPFKKEFRINQKSNQTIWALGFGKTIEWSNTGHPTKILGCILDISDRKKQEIWLKEHHYFLKELAFEQSHTLRARVANILGILEILESEPQSMESIRLVQLIRNETKLLDQSLKKSIKESVQKNISLENDFADEPSMSGL
ncbi:PAS domain S-box-containing protein [Algoriphagus sp. 4150]|uniref:PAS domain-containing protein n=1 Tax=Algoriphagus sp. 4150 TaxID=2817756 RepID=UPI002855DE23|nr:PAS domain-containing protein [Algoriphagus sp. 4150]MDR7129507.1 PAS domain S-box-containing protein [Algoriphagus sp. 4150]